MSGIFICVYLACIVVTLVMVCGLVLGDDNGGKSSYDFIIVGAGSAGSVVAAELAKSFPKMDILVVEEGYYSSINPGIEDMSNYPNIVNDETIKRFYKSIPQVNLFDREIGIFRTKVTGGCNSHNGEIYIWAHENDFERWGNIDGWTLDDLLPLWDELESVTYHDFESSLGDVWMNYVINASAVLGYEFNDNWNDLKDGKTQEGVAHIRLQAELINDSFIQRHSSWTDYMEPILSYDNLHIEVLKRVNKVILSNNNDKAIGIEIEDIGTSKKEIIYAKEEIILSASIFDTPKILLLSGIGDCNELKDVDIECLVDLPGVGKGLQDHIVIPVMSPPIIDRDAFESQLPDYFKNGAIITNGAGIAFDDGDHLWEILVQQYGDNDDDDRYYSLNLYIVNNRVLSQGSVTLYDNNPATPPVIDFNYLDNEDDIKLVFKTLKLGREFLYDTGVFDGLFESKENEISPGYEYLTDDEIIYWLKKYGIGTANPGAHTGGSCKMSDDINDNYAVVNERLKVNGVRNLRIVDTSIMPQVVSANPNQMAMVIGLKGAKMIIQDHPHCK